MDLGYTSADDGGDGHVHEEENEEECGMESDDKRDEGRSGDGGETGHTAERDKKKTTATKTCTRKRTRKSAARRATA